MAWRRPRWAARLQPKPVADLLAEAHALGVVGRGAISTPIRMLLAGDSEADVVAAMAKVLPKPIDHFLLQADLTVVVPGPLERELAEQLSAVATVESAGAAMVYRISEQSIRRALDTGRTRGRDARVLRTALENARAARVDVSHRRRRPQARPTAGRHGGLVRPVRGSRAAGPGRRRSRAETHWTCGSWRPTVAVSQAPIAEVLAALRAAGFAPAAEDCVGHDRRHPRPRRPGARRPIRRRGYRPPSGPERADAGRDRRRDAQGGGRTVPAGPTRPGRGDGAAAAARRSSRRRW